jgi:hypothetical protein
MERYSKFRPTAFDTAGLGCEDRQDWYVAPVSQTRDSEPLEISNYRVVLRDLEEIDPDGNDHEEHRFGHWGPGWFDIILVRPNSACAKSAECWEDALSDYPVADESDLSELECEAEQEAWDNLTMRWRIKACARCRISIFAARRDYPPSDDQGRMRDYLLGH